MTQVRHKGTKYQTTLAKADTWTMAIFVNKMMYNDSYTDFLARLKAGLRAPLPGVRAHMKVATAMRMKEIESPSDTSLAKKGSVLVLLYPERENVRMPLILRPDHGDVHGGQISFPGGAFEPSDETLTVTALREAWEEIGLQPDSLTVIGRLSHIYIPPSNFLVEPVVASMQVKPVFRLNRDEVIKVLEVKVDELLHTPLQHVDIDVRGRVLKAPSFVVEGHPVWGATAMIISELLEVIRDYCTSME
jgi:8-oxo-dGTP pyrophosphatase MutT (NUDIX family)